MNSNLKIFSGTHNKSFAESICNHLQIKLGDIYHHSFPSNETYVQIHENVRGSDVFLVSCRGIVTNDALMELLVMADAARRASADRITAVVPFYYYSRQDRKEKSRVPISARLVADLYAASGINRIISMDLHCPQIGGFTNLPFDHLTFEPVLVNYIRNKYKNFDFEKDVILMAPDVGAVKRVEKYADSLNADFGFISKKRIDDEKVELQSIVGDIKDKYVILIDDMTESVGTLSEAAKACKDNGALNVMAAVTHGCFTEKGISKLNNTLNSGVINEFVCSNIFRNEKLNGKITELDVSKTFASAINNIHNNESVSELFVMDENN
jgi:ribose-phosphate pyrophosphokinase